MKHCVPVVLALLGGCVTFPPGVQLPAMTPAVREAFVQRPAEGQPARSAAEVEQARPLARLPYDHVRLNLAKAAAHQRDGQCEEAIALFKDIQAQPVATAADRLTAGTRLEGMAAGDCPRRDFTFSVMRYEPTYPRQALREGVTGTVVALVRFEMDGSVGALEIIEASHAIFESPAKQSIQRWRATPREGTAFLNPFLSVQDFVFTIQP